MENNTTEASVPTIVSEGENQVVSPTENDLEAKYKALEEEKARLEEVRLNYQAAIVKQKSKQGNLDDDEDDKVRRVVYETLAESSLAKVNKEQQELIAKTLKENKELRLANLNKLGTPPASMGSHSEGIAVRDTLITPEQMAQFRAAGKDDKWIANYKKNLQKVGGR